jgi:hypothetical protein
MLMETNGYYIMAFDSTHHAIRTESLMKKERLEGEIIPTPRDIDVSCGLSIKLPGHSLDRLRCLIDTSQNRVRLYRIDIVEGGTVYIEQEK